ncbi:MAG: prepilin-type N-terminal cleavage/methylation domain-containing protein [Chthoniobacter sp.]|nr:prepilin-type N-terminal cleavage/methylation domain-containing protein [Chthoniobacter sp.]
MKHRRKSQSGFTLVEILVAASVGLVVSGLAFSYLRAGTLLLAKNVSVNMSNNELRSAIDQIQDRMQTATSIPILINTNGTAATSPAAGVYFDRLVGEPYVVTHPGGSGLSAAATSVTVTRSTSAYASPPIPIAGDVLLIDGATSTMRPRVSSVTTGAISGGLQTITITFTAALGTAIDWDASFVKTATLTRREAFIVMPGAGRSELRRYSSFETTTDFNDATQYTVISRQVGTQTGETTPFSIVTVGLDKLVNIDFRVRTAGFENALAAKESNTFSGFMRVQCMVPSRQRPKN